MVRANSARWALWAFVVVGCLTPMVTLGWAVYVEAANAPIWDDWLKLFTTVQHTVEGRPWLEDIYQQYGPARYVGTQVVTALSVWLTGWNLRVLVWFHYALTAGGGLVWAGGGYLPAQLSVVGGVGGGSVCVFAI